MKKFLILTLTLLLIISFSAFAQYEVGEYVEDFQLPDQNGNPVNLYDYQDYIVILPFWEDG